MSEHNAAQASPDRELPEREALRAASEAFDVSLRHRLLLWLLRWIAGFAAIAVIVYLWPELAWLWWAAAAVAGLSLVLMLAIHRFVGRRAAQATRRLGEFDRFVRELEEKERSQDFD